jgi:hypothetical protein
MVSASPDRAARKRGSVPGDPAPPDNAAGHPRLEQHGQLAGEGRELFRSDNPAEHNRAPPGARLGRGWVLAGSRLRGARLGNQLGRRKPPVLQERGRGLRAGAVNRALAFPAGDELDGGEDESGHGQVSSRSCWFIGRRCAA